MCRLTPAQFVTSPDHAPELTPVTATALRASTTQPPVVPSGASGSAARDREERRTLPETAPDNSPETVVFLGWDVVDRATDAVEQFVAVNRRDAANPRYIEAVERGYRSSRWTLERVYLIEPSAGAAALDHG